MSGFDINQLAISGNLTCDPKLLHLDDGSVLCKLRIANNDRTKNPTGEWINRPQFFNVTIWAGIGQWIADNLAKGDKVVLAGRLKWSEWDADDGRRQAIEIHADSIVPITTIKDTWEPHEDHGNNVNPVAGETDIPF
jgi:single-strand DNA-binding protein